MEPLYAGLEESYAARCGNPLLALEAWKSYASAHPPAITFPAGPAPLPSQSLALETGDFGLSLLWIVQATIVRAFANEVARDTESTYPGPDIFPVTAIGSLAHSENRENPVIIRESGDSVLLSGKKKYITGGLDSDFIFLTARREGDDSVTSLVYLPEDLIPRKSLTNLNLGILKTISHASLDLRDLRVPAEYHIPVAPRTLRKHLKIWGMVERVLIMESFIAVMLYLVRRMGKLSDMDEGISDLLELHLASQEAASRDALAKASSGERISPGGADTTKVLEVYEKMGEFIRSRGEHNNIPEPHILRYNDLGLIAGMKS